MKMTGGDTKVNYNPELEQFGPKTIDKIEKKKSSSGDLLVKEDKEVGGVSFRDF